VHVIMDGSEYQTVLLRVCEQGAARPEEARPDDSGRIIAIAVAEGSELLLCARQRHGRLLRIVHDILAGTVCQYAAPIGRPALPFANDDLIFKGGRRSSATRLVRTAILVY